MTTERKVINLAERKLQRLGGLPAPSIEVAIPDFISPPDISSMTDAQLEQVLNLIRMRRLQSRMVYEKTAAEKEALDINKARVALEKKAEQVYNLLAKTFDVLDKLELKVNEMRALRIQAGLEF